MRKLGLIIFSMLLCGCMSAGEEAKKVNIASYFGTYYQKKIVYVNLNQYKEDKQAFYPTLAYTLSKEEMVFEDDLVYKPVTYVKEEATEFDKKVIKDVVTKFVVKEKNENVGITILMSDKNVYIANDAMDHRGYTYIAEMKKK